MCCMEGTGAREGGAGEELERQRSFEETLNELSQCREDERTAQNQILSTVAAAATVLSVIFGTSLLGMKGDELAWGRFVLFILSNFVFGATFGYILEMGIQNCMRYHYIQWLEDRLARLHPRPWEESQGYVSWLSFRSPVTTGNIAHIRSGYTLLHYVCFTGAVVFAALFCGGVVVCQYLVDGTWPFRVVLGVSCIVLAVTVGLFFYVCACAPRMCRFAWRESRARKGRRLGGNKTEKAE